MYLHSYEKKNDIIFISLQTKYVVFWTLFHSYYICIITIHIFLVTYLINSRFRRYKNINK